MTQVACSLLCSVAVAAGPGAADDGEIRLLVRADDMGAAHAINVARIQACMQGIARSVEVIVPGPWYPEVVHLLRASPHVDVGVHLDLTAEWDRIKWGPLTHAPSLVDANGHFFPTTRQRRTYPPNTGFIEAEPKLDEVKRELRAQIERAIRDIPQVSHLSAHMGTATATPALRELVHRLAQEYKLPIDFPDLRRARVSLNRYATNREKEAAFLKMLETLTPGAWLFVEHPGLDTPELQAIGHIGARNVAAERAGVTYVFTSPRVKALIEKRNIKLVSYRDLQPPRTN